MDLRLVYRSMLKTLICLGVLGLVAVAFACLWPWTCTTGRAGGAANRPITWKTAEFTFDRGERVRVEFREVWSGMNGPYEVELLDGSIPPGLTLVMMLDVGIQGTPSTPGTYVFTLRSWYLGVPGRDMDTQNDQTFTIVVRD